MKNDDVVILTQQAGRFDRRFGIGPVCWPYFDILWIHEGAVRLHVGAEPQVVDLVAPSGILVFPHTPFQGGATRAFADASICHFSGGVAGVADGVAGFWLPDPRDAFHVQNLIRLSLTYARRGDPMPMRKRLLHAVIDCFQPRDAAPVVRGRLSEAWARAEGRLDRIRTLSDVAAGIGLSESAFRARHRAETSGSAGKHLQDLRLDTAERLLATTGATVAEVARAVGYAHTESFSSAFKTSRGRTPAVYRRWCKRFA